MPTLEFGIELRQTTVFVRFSRRIQHRGKDFQLYANSDFAPLYDSDSPFLHHLSQILRMNDSGIDHVIVKPFALSLDRTFFTEPDRLKRLVETAAHRACLRTGYLGVQERMADPMANLDEAFACLTG